MEPKYCNKIVKMLTFLICSLVIAPSLQGRNEVLIRGVGGLVDGLIRGQQQSRAIRRHPSPARGSSRGSSSQWDRYQRQAAEQQRRFENDRLRQIEVEQRRLQKEADNRARQLEVQRKKAETEAAKAEAQRLEMQRLQRLSEEQRMQRQLADDRRRQIEMEKQELALDRQRWKEEADHEGWFVFGIHIPSWLWQAGVVGVLGWILSLIFRRGR